METTSKSQREYARVAVRLNVRFQPLESDEEARRIEEELLAAPSVWAPPGESELWKLADSTGSGSEGLLATALLALTAQVERLGRKVEAGGPMEIGEILDLSCNGARFSTKLLLKEGSRLLIALGAADDEAPPVRVLGEVVHRDGAQGGLFGVAFKVVHPTDKERLTRYIYGLQRAQLRRASQDRS